MIDSNLIIVYHDLQRACWLARAARTIPDRINSEPELFSPSHSHPRDTFFAEPLLILVLQRSIQPCASRVNYPELGMSFISAYLH